MIVRVTNRVQNQKPGLQVAGTSKEAKDRKNLSFVSFFLLLPFSLLLPKVAQAEPAQSPPIFQNVTISPRFSPDPITIQGISGGSIPLHRIAGREETPNGPCVGFADEQPDHTLVLTSFFSYLSIQVQSPADTTILVRGPGGSWCNDDVKGKNPGIAGQWLPGTYGVWVGSYQKGRYHPYILQITETH